MSSEAPVAAPPAGLEAGVFDYLRRHAFERLVLCNDSASGLRAVIAIHSTALGPANGGLRMRPYASEQEAILDALRLARGMTYKWAAAGEDRGGGKAVIIGDPRTDKSEALLRSFGRFVDGLGGAYYTGEDVGTTLEDMEVIYRETDYVATLPEHVGGVGDISGATALGALQAMRACVRRVWGDPSLAGRSVALQGLGMVGSKALELLLEAGAEVLVADVDPAKVAWATGLPGVRAVAPDAIHAQDVDVYAPFALGGVVNDATLPEIRARVIAGSANNVLAEERHGDELERRGIVYAVDYVANAGGAIMDAHQFHKGGFVRERALAAVERIYERTEAVFERAERDGVPFYRAANAMAEERIAAVGRLRGR
jgi:leucine dehydrogenase